MILTVKVTPSVFERKDSIFVGDSVLYCIKDLTILKGNINSIVNECPESAGKATTYSLDAQNCIVIKGIAKGIDTTCLKVCTDSGQCFRIKLITTVFDKKDTLEFMRHDSLYVGDSVCINIGNSILKGNIINVQNDCSNTSNRAARYAFEMSNCLSIKGLKVGIDTACLLICTDSNICIKIRAVTSVLNKNNNNNADTIRLVYEVGEVDTVCIPTSIKLGTGITMTNLCPDTTNKTVSYKIINDTCLVITAQTKGNVKTCWEICDANRKCDTVVVDITVITSDSIRLPIANYDTARTILNQTVVLSPLLNDSINGVLDTVRVMTIPFNGTAVANKDSLGRWTIAYTPDRGFCNTEKEDEFVYEVCNQQGCDTAIIYVRVLCDKLKIYNAFSPNGDNKNDVFYIDGLGNFPNTHVKVYNRWGNLVFDDKDYKNTWNGMWNGLKLPDGTYYYHITLENGEKYVGYLQIHH
jgi:gliding motility-associated-like protein